MIMDMYPLHISCEHQYLGTFTRLRLLLGPLRHLDTINVTLTVASQS